MVTRVPGLRLKCVIVASIAALVIAGLGVLLGYAAVAAIAMIATGSANSTAALLAHWGAPLVLPLGAFAAILIAGNIFNHPEHL
jgi:hypothetical protein